MNQGNQETGKTTKDRLAAIAKKLYPDSVAGCEGCIASVQYKRDAYIFQSIRSFEGKTEKEVEQVLAASELAANSVNVNPYTL